MCHKVWRLQGRKQTRSIFLWQKLPALGGFSVFRFLSIEIFERSKTQRKQMKEVVWLVQSQGTEHPQCARECGCRQLSFTPVLQVVRASWIYITLISGSFRGGHPGHSYYYTSCLGTLARTIWESASWEAWKENGENKSKIPKRTDLLA